MPGDDAPLTLFFDFCASQPRFFNRDGRRREETTPEIIFLGVHIMFIGLQGSRSFLVIKPMILWLKTLPPGNLISLSCFCPELKLCVHRL